MAGHGALSFLSRERLGFWSCYYVSLHVGNVWASMVAKMIKNLPAVQETQVRSLSREDPLEKVMATHSSVDRGSGQATVHGVTKSRT